MYIIGLPQWCELFVLFLHSRSSCRNIPDVEGFGFLAKVWSASPHLKPLTVKFAKKKSETELEAAYLHVHPMHSCDIAVQSDSYNKQEGLLFLKSGVCGRYC